MSSRGRIYFVGVWLFVSAFVAFGLVVKLSGLDPDDHPIGGVIGGSLMLGLTLFWAACCRPLRCPRCRRFLRPSPNRRIEHQELYVCKRCDIEWDTGVPISDA